MLSSAPSGSNTAPLDVFSDFSGYVTATSEDYQEVFRSGMVVLDTNVLLDLYRQHPAAVEQLFRAMESLGGSVWFPHQVLVEFHRNRASAATEPNDDAEKSRAKLHEFRQSALVEFRWWTQRVGISPELERDLRTQFEQGFDALTSGISKVLDEHDPEMVTDTNTDERLSRLNAIVTGRRGSPMTDADYAAALTEAKRRIGEKQPPGFHDVNKSKDKNPNQEGAAGDYLVWEQLLVEASERKVETLFVTRDAKPDWYWVRSGEVQGPRNELAEEYRTRTGCRLFMLRTASWLHHMKEFLVSRDPKVDAAEVASAVEAIDRTAEDAVAEEGGGWTAGAVRRLMSELRDYYPIQYDAIRRAFSNDGYVSRDAVYELAGYGPDRSLRGFTRPIERLTRLLVDEEVLPYFAESALVAYYDFQATGNNKAIGFGLSSGFLTAYVEAYGE
jgi:predicted nucleic acid-binding protein